MWEHILENTSESTIVLNGVEGMEQEYFNKYNPLLSASYHSKEKLGVVIRENGTKEYLKTTKKDFCLSSGEYDVWNAIFALLQDRLKKLYYKTLPYYEAYPMEISLSEIASLVYTLDYPANYLGRIREAIERLQSTQIVLRGFYIPRNNKQSLDKDKIETKDFLVQTIYTSPILECSYDETKKNAKLLFSRIIVLSAWYSKNYTRISIQALNSMKNKYAKLFYEWILSNTPTLKEKQDVEKDLLSFVDDEDKKDKKGSVIRINDSVLKSIFRSNLPTCGRIFNSISKKSFIADMKKIYPDFDYTIKRSEVIFSGIEL